MNYIEHLNQYRIARTQNPLSTNAIALYFILLEFNNSLGWIETFTVANSVLMGLSDLSRDSFNRARNELKQKGFIEYDNGSGNQAGKYLIVRFAIQPAHNPHTSDTQPAHKPRTLTKLKKTKLNTSCPDPKGPVTEKLKRVYEEDSQEMQLSNLLSSLMLANKPDGLMPKDYQSWCNSFRLMMEQDKREFSSIERVIKFSQWDNFWKNNIRSAGKLRDKFDQLEMRMEGEREKYEAQSGG